MPRPIDIPSVQHRAENLINLTVRARTNIGKHELRGASCLTDAYGAGGGVPGFGTIAIYEAIAGDSWVSKNVAITKVRFPEESDRNLTRFIWDPDEFDTPSQPGVASSLPLDKNVQFVRIRSWNTLAGAYEAEGPIVIIPPYDFYTTAAPVFTVTSVVPNLAWGYAPGVYPDTLDAAGVMSLELPSVASTFQIYNTSVPGGFPIYLSFNLGMSPAIIMPGENIVITGCCPPEVNLAADGGNPTFTSIFTISGGSY